MRIIISHAHKKEKKISFLQIKRDNKHGYLKSHKLLARQVINKHVAQVRFAWRI